MNTLLSLPRSLLFSQGELSQNLAEFSDAVIFIVLPDLRFVCVCACALLCAWICSLFKEGKLMMLHAFTI